MLLSKILLVLLTLFSCKSHTSKTHVPDYNFILKNEEYKMILLDLNDEKKLTEIKQMFVDIFFESYKKQNFVFEIEETEDKFKARMLKNIINDIEYAKKLNNNSKFYTIDHNKKTIGFIILEDISSGHSQYNGTQRLHIRQLLFTSEYQNKGLGYAIMKQAHILYPYNNIFVLDTRIKNKLAIKSYQRMGFKNIKTVDPELDSNLYAGYEKIWDKDN